jgi:hypothetical protein
MGHIRKPQVPGDLFHTGVGISRLPFCLQHHPLPDMLTGRMTGDLFDDLIQIVGRHIQTLKIRFHEYDISLFFRRFRRLSWLSQTLSPGLVRP